MRRIVLTTIALVCALLATEAREIYSLNDNWKFFYQNDASSDNAQRINLPHSWNTEQAGSETLLHTTGKYQRTLHIPAEWRDKRLFVRFHGVQSVADVFLNGAHVGDHRGAYTAFTFEITDKVFFGADNTLLVAMSNAYRSDVLPTSIEDNMYGGIYRDVELLVTERTAVSPLYYGTDGIIVHQTEATTERASGTIQVVLTGKKDSSCNLTLAIAAPDGYISTEKSVKAKIDNRPISVPYTIENPELWSPSRPALYTVRVTIGNEVVEVKTGLRKVAITAAGKATINDRQLFVRGVTLHHDNRHHASALTSADINADLDIIAEMGANAVRSAVGPHDQHLYDECDRRGMLVWIDSPFVRAPFMGDIAYYSTPHFEKNGTEQLTEIVMQNINHPSVVMWGIFSALRGNAKPQLDYIRHLNAVAKQCDPSRPTVACSSSDGAMNFITDLIVWQQNIGWHKGSTDDLTVWQSALRSSWNHLAQAVCYGEGGVRGIYDDCTKGDISQQHLVPEVRQTRFHEQYAQQIDETLFWGVWLNSMFDFGSVRREGGLRTSGVVGFDHAERKDAFYLYKMLWNHRTPTLHIVDKHHTLRSEERQAFTIYTARSKPVLRINGDTVAVQHVAKGIFHSDTVRLKGLNEIEVTSGELRDGHTLTVGNFIKVEPRP
ncbi:MAG: beta-galactosidase [Alistipes sp.]|nr:beta-galactosidase [Alistipes sp.]